MRLKLSNVPMCARIGLLLAGAWLVCMLAFQPWSQATRSGLFEGPTKFLWDLGSGVEEPVRELAWRRVESQYAERGKGSLDLSEKQAAAFRRQSEWWSADADKNSRRPHYYEWEMDESAKLAETAERFSSEGFDRYYAEQKYFHDSFNPFHGYIAASVAACFLFFLPYTVAWAVRPLCGPASTPPAPKP